MWREIPAFSYMHTHEDKPDKSNYIDHFQPTITAFFDNPVVVILVAFVAQKFYRWVNGKTERLKASLLFSQKKDQHIAVILQTLRESVRSDRVVLGLIVNGETAITNQYHIKSLIITHESLGAGIRSLNTDKRGKIPLSVMGKEEDLYKTTNFVFAQINDDLDPNCRRYLDSIDCLQILTFKLVSTYKKEEITVGYLSFQWTKKITMFLTEIDISQMLNAEGKRDFIYFKNHLTDIILSSKDTQKLLTNLEKI
jgi:hypothetical protein